MTETLLRTKLYIPPARPQLVPRPRLIDQLNAGVHRKLTLVAAPPGFGKTTLMIEWQDSLPKKQWQMIWVSLDEQDNDPVRFWSYIVAALNTIQPDVGAETLTMLQSPQFPGSETVLTTLINAVTGLSQQFVLVLDDYHIIENEVIHQGLTFLLDNLPPQMRLAMTSRTEPPLPLNRLRVRSQLTELREADLRFTPNEIATFLNQVMGLNLSTNDVSALQERTEGWVAGLQLAALSMQGYGDTQRFVQAFTGSHRYVIDYLAEEVLAQQPPYVRAFLLRTSILDRLCGPLCDELINGQLDDAPHSDSQSILEHLERANLFLIPLDNERRWYRYHHLFADFLQAQLQNHQPPDKITALHRRASDWYARHNLTLEAVKHALAAGAPPLAAELIEGELLELLGVGEVNTVLNWLQAMPDKFVQERPRLTLGHAWASLILNRFDEVSQYLTYTEASVAPYLDDPSSQTPAIKAMLGEISALQAIIADFEGETDRAIHLCQEALARLPDGNPLVRSIILMTLGGAYESRGEFDEAVLALKEAISLSLSLSRSATVVAITSLGNLANIQREQGRLQDAAQTYHQAMNTLTQNGASSGGLPYSLTRWAYLGLAELHREWNNLDEAEQRYLTPAFDNAEQGHYFGDLTIAYIIKAQLLRGRGNFEAAQEAVQKAKQLLVESPAARWLDAVQARLWLIRGNLPAAAAWANSSGLPSADRGGYTHLPGENMTLARVWMAQERYVEVADLLEKMRVVFSEENRQGRLLEATMLQAINLFVQGKRDQALGPLTVALTLGEAGGYVRTFLDEGPVISQLLSFAKDKIEPALKGYLTHLLTESNNEAGYYGDVTPSATTTTKAPLIDQPLIEPLSERELEVLHLIAAGLSNQQIADQLIIAEGTVKKHIHNIFGKLDVRRRSQAILRATELGLI